MVTCTSISLPVVEPIIPTARPTPFNDPAWLFEPKYDGFREVLYLTQRGRIRHSKLGNAMTRFRGLAERVRAELPHREVILDREIVALDVDWVEVARALCQELRREFDEGRAFFLFPVAAAYVRLGDNDAALDTLEEALRWREGYMPFVLTEPAFDELRGRPRFERLLERSASPIATLRLGLRDGGATVRMYFRSHLPTLRHHPARDLRMDIGGWLPVIRDSPQAPTPQLPTSDRG